MGRVTHVAFSITVVGKVQGVGFRAFAQDSATRLGLAGWVANQRDGSVLVEVSGGAAVVVEFVAILRGGPPGSVVSDLRATPINPGRVAIAGFEIRQ